MTTNDPCWVCSCGHRQLPCSMCMGCGETQPELVESTTWTGLPYTPPEEWTKADERESNMETRDPEMGS